MSRAVEDSADRQRGTQVPMDQRLPPPPRLSVEGRTVR